MKLLRAAANSMFFWLWTAFLVTCAVTRSLVRRDPEIFRNEQRRWARDLLRFWGVDLVVAGAEHVDPTRSYVIIANHQSYADIVALFVALPVIPGFMAKRELLRVPFLAAALRAGRHVIVDRNRHQSAVATLEAAAEQVRAGKTVLVFPEGTRTAGKVIAPFKKGGFHLAKAAGVPIVPVGLRGTGAVGPLRSLLFWPGRIEVHIGPPITPETVARTGVDDLLRQARARIGELAAMPLRD